MKPLALALSILASASALAQPFPDPPPPPPTPAPEPPPAPPPVEASDIQFLKADLARLERNLEAERKARLALEAKLAAQAVEAGRAAPSLPLALRWRLGYFEAGLSGLVQADAVAFRESSVDEITPTGEPLNQTRFLLRRARLRLDVAYKILFGALELDANTVRGSTVRVMSGWVGVRYKSYVAITVGLQRIPFGYELRERARERFFLERSNVVQALFPSAFDLGVVVQGGWRFLRYAVAAMNGNPVSDALAANQFQARDPNQSKDFLGRIGGEWRFGSRVGLQGGLSALYGQGFHAGTPGTKDVLVWRDIDENGIVALPEIQVIAGTAAAPSSNFDRYAVGGDLRLTVDLPKLGELALYGEVIWGANLDRGRMPSDPVASGRTLRQLGFYAAMTLELTRWAQFGLRYDRYDPDLDSIDQRGFTVVPRDMSFSTVAVGLAARLVPYGRLLVQYDHNDNALGRTPAGLPTRLADDTLTLRAQVQF